MVFPGEVMMGGPQRRTVIVRAALPRGFGLPGYRGRTKTMRCNASEARAVHCPAAQWAAFERACRMHLSTWRVVGRGARARVVADGERVEEEELYGAGGKDLATSLALQGLRAWPRVVGAGCCALRVGDEQRDGQRDGQPQQVSFVPLPVELRERLAEHDPVDAPSECRARSLSRPACARLGILRSLAGLQALTEHHHASFDEHVDASGAELLDGQWCYRPRDNGIVACDTDFVRLWEPRAWGLSRSFSTAVRPRPRRCGPSCRVHRFLHAGDGDDGAGRRPPNETRLVDLPLAFAATALRPLVAALPPVRALVDEIEARGRALAAGDESARQLTFSCMHAWLRAATSGMPE